MDSSEEKYTPSQAQRPSGDGDATAAPSNQPVSPSLQRAVQAHYVDPTTEPTPFPPPPPGGSGDDTPTLRGYPAPRWPGQACRYCGWRPVVAGSTCPQCHQSVPDVASWAVPWREVAIGALSLTTVLVVVMVFLLLHHAPATSSNGKARGITTPSTTPSANPVGAVTATAGVPPTGVPVSGATGTPVATAGVGGGGAPNTPVAGAATPTPTPVPGKAPTNTPTPTCSWQTSTMSGTYYIYWPGDSTYGLGHYGYTISTTIHYDGCGRAYASVAVTSNDVGSPPSYVSAVLYRTADCTGGDKVLSQQNTVTLPAGNQSTTTASPTSLGQHCVYAVGIDRNDANNSQSVPTIIVNAS